MDADGIQNGLEAVSEPTQPSTEPMASESDQNGGFRRFHSYMMAFASIIFFAHMDGNCDTLNSRLVSGLKTRGQSTLNGDSKT